MKSFHEEREHILESIRLTYDEETYTGNGSMSWNPEEGFHIRALLSKPAVARNKIVTFGGAKLEDSYSILLKPRGYDRAVAEHVPPTSNIKLLISNYLSVNVRRVVFFRSYELSKEFEHWNGTALLQLSHRPMLPDKVEREARLNDLTIGSGTAMEGLWHDGEDFRLAAYLTEENELELVWRIPKEVWLKKQNWLFPEAAMNALSILTAQTARLRQRETYGNGITRIGIYHPLEVRRLPAYLRPFDMPILPKDIFIRLTSFFARKENHSQTCINIFRQMAEASRQRSWQSMELLLSTILEAALRNIDGHAFVPGDTSFKIDASAKRFQDKYLSAEWMQYRLKALSTMRRLRHRNAHPDWFLDQGGDMSREEHIQSIDDLTFLSRFYGYMILALAGFKNLEPEFPAPYKG